MLNTNPTKVHAVIISWEGYGLSAREIAEKVGDHVDMLSVIYSNKAEVSEAGPGTWVSVQNSLFFGAKFRKALDTYDGGVLFLIHADTEFSDWPALVGRCRQVFDSHPNLGLWSPDFTHSSFDNDLVRIGDGPDAELISVAFPDGLVLALREDVVDRLKALDYAQNNLGWGIVWAAAAYCFINNLLVCRETNLLVTHEKIRGYKSDEASKQRDNFLSQLSIEEQNQIVLLRDLIKARRLSRFPVRSRLIRKLRSWI